MQSQALPLQLGLRLPRADLLPFSGCVIKGTAQAQDVKMTD